MKRNSLALVIVLTILITGCKQATEPSVPNVTVPEVEALPKTIDVTQLKGSIVTLVAGTESEAGVAGTNSNYIKASEKLSGIQFDVSDIFTESRRKEALTKMINQSFSIYSEQGLSVDSVSIVVEETVNEGELSVKKASALITFSIDAMLSDKSFARDSDGNEINTAIIEMEDQYKALYGVEKIENAEIDIAYEAPSGLLKNDNNEEVSVVVMGVTGWSIVDGGNSTSARKILAKKDAGVMLSSIGDAIQAKLAAVESISSKYTYEIDTTSVKTDETTGKVMVPVVLTSTTGYLFDNGTDKKIIDISVILQEGELTVNDEDFAETLEAISNPDNLGGLADADGNVTVQITGNIKNDNNSGTPEPFEVSGGTVEKPLNLTFEVPAGSEGVEVDGGGILTSLVVSGPGTTVTVGEGITISGGKSSTGGGVIVKDGGHFILDGGTITGNISTGSDLSLGGAGVNVINGTFTMKNGLITGNTGERGGAIYAGSSNNIDSVFINLEGGTISNNVAKVGGAIYARYANVTIANTSIINNTATSSDRDYIGGGSGGALVITGSTTYMTINEGTLITGNNAALYGGAVSTASGGHLILNGGVIKDNYRLPLSEDGEKIVDNIVGSAWAYLDEVTFGEGIIPSTDILQDGVSNKIVDDELIIARVLWQNLNQRTE